MAEQKPLLSVAIIFKNEIRCLERCLLALQPLREHIPLQIVMADTGSDDGSREVAERYADVFFDFPWINDFAAARNAVLRRCTGAWIMVVDADERLNENFTQLVEFVKNPRNRRTYVAASLIIRNYTRTDLTGEYSDFYNARVFRNWIGYHYEGAIHEHVTGTTVAGKLYMLNRTVLDHDGYGALGAEASAAKKKRNMELLRVQAREKPNDPLTMILCLESADGEEKKKYLEHGLEVVRAKGPAWKEVGPAIFRHAVYDRFDNDREKLKEIYEEGYKLFPDSLYIQIDSAYIMTTEAIQRKDYGETALYGERYLNGLDAYRSNLELSRGLSVSALHMCSLEREMGLKLDILEAFFEDGRYEAARDLLTRIDYKYYSPLGIARVLAAAVNVHVKSQLDMGGILRDMWDNLSKEERDGVLPTALTCFARTQYVNETQQNCRHAAELFQALGPEELLGQAGALVAAKTGPELDAALRSVTDWKALPSFPLAYALENGAKFPPAGKNMGVEALTMLADKLAKDGELKGDLPLAPIQECGFPALCWQEMLVRYAMEGCNWREDRERSLALANAFAAIERRYLPAYYSENMLTEENCRMLPPAHRFAWFLIRSMDALEGGNTKESVRILHDGLLCCEGMKDFAELLLEDIQEKERQRAIQDVSPELAELAEKVRAILSACDPEDPAVEALKQSPVYQKVAWMIEAPAGRVRQ